MPADKTTPLRAAMFDVIRQSCKSDEEANVILDRISARLGGYSHAEVAAMHPMPVGEDTSNE